jgi:segregation and condensation protein A
LPANLERQIRRRAVAQPPQRRRVTLKELIDQLRTIATALDEQTPRVRRPRPQSRTQAVRAIAQLAHQENLSEMAVALEQFFIDQWQTIAQGESWLDFDLLLELWSQASDYKAGIPHDPHAGNATHDRVGIFWALLLLSAQSKVELAQEEFYQDLKIQLLSEQALSNWQIGQRVRHLINFVSIAVDTSLMRRKRAIALLSGRHAFVTKLNYRCDEVVI